MGCGCGKKKNTSSKLLPRIYNNTTKSSAPKRKITRKK